MSTLSIIIILVAVVLVLWAVTSYNSLVKLRNNRENAFANIDVQLKQRHDLIPQLVATVKGYATHEREVLQRVTEARTAAMSASGINEKIAAENALSSALAGLKVSLEAYPELKANQNFLQLQTEIADVENKLAAVRRFFNSATRELNNAVETFPSNILAGMFGFTASLCSRFRRRVVHSSTRPRTYSSDITPRMYYEIRRYADADKPQQHTQCAVAACVSVYFARHGVGVPGRVVLVGLRLRALARWHGDRF